MNGFVVIDKPVGLTSHDVVNRVRRILGTRRVGHTGTLDPFATGVLPVAVNEGTKAIPFLDEGQKVYEALLRLGVKTDTLDMTGRVLHEADGTQVSRDRLEAVVADFTGEISQMPPMFSAIKQDGQPLYKLARKGQEVERQARQVQIYSLEIVSVDLPLVALRVVCSRGTYVRSLADDMGAALGCGAALQELRRTASGPFTIAASMTLDELQEAAQEGRTEAVCRTPYAVLGHLMDIPLTDAGVVKVRHGRAPELDETGIAAWPACAAPLTVRLSQGQELVAVAELSSLDGEGVRIALKRVFC
ncbi:tRNA pseudouridine(55) synthase TruB [Oryzomonas japonica]|uniref:tRNA pseudouridine synthase B n=1 Tax=Oryzomonas japonica TaxID=2603858 RepID=A0A7J4ZRQ6_9BACT|nr:tRNA pseudouridine(55) synthase TruB [Oryzomonas japonica]KAB0665803.1 tRNA pseudouridine(55) synthase TruB [Oryzomonas japonica]